MTQPVLLGQEVRWGTKQIEPLPFRVFATTFVVGVVVVVVDDARNDCADFRHTYALKLSPFSAQNVNLWRAGTPEA